MLEFLRRQTKPIMITLAAIIIIAFTFWGGYTNKSDFGQGHSDGDTVLTVLGSDYTMNDLNRLQRAFVIARDLGLPGVSTYYAAEVVRLKFTLGSRDSGGALMVADAPVDFAPNLVILRDAFQRYGIYASDDEVQQAFRSLGQFQVNGQFDRDRALEYERSLGSSGTQLSDVYEVIRDSIGLQKLHKLVAGNLVANPKNASERYAFGYQTIKVASIPFAIADYKKTAQVSDEEITKYFEENKDSYRSMEKRAISYVMAEKPNTDGKNAEDTVKLRNAYNEKLGNLASAVITPGAKFEDEVKKAGYEVKSAPAFSLDAPPEALAKEFELLRAIFSNNPSTHAVSDPVPVDKGYVIFAVTKVIPPAPQELKDVKDKVRDALVSQKAAEAMQKAANEAKKKLEEAIKGGKKFEDAAKEAGLTPQMLAEFSPTNPPTDLSNGSEIAQEASGTPAGSFTKPVATTNGILLLHVLSKELRKREDSATAKREIADGLNNLIEGEMFRAWFERRYEEAKVKFAPVLLNSALVR